MSQVEVTNNNRSGRPIDDALHSPAGDLLDMDRHAKALATYITDKKLPFTVGIFGEWGEGKTTMVHFLRHHLEEQHGSQPAAGNADSAPFYWVEFSAWPYTSSEKLWRALILGIAKVLLGEPDDETPGSNRTEKDERRDHASWFDRLTSFLTSDFFPADTATPYQKFVQDLERTDFGRISTRVPSSQLSGEAITTAVVDGALTVMGSVSPLVAGLRGLLGFQPNAQLERSKQIEAEESSRAMAALPRFQDTFRKMVERQARGQPVYVFIDDLDRAQPDVALDIMESIRIALSDVDCVFIIAVDETLISQGLRLRYKELFADENKAALANKGQEYLEKIIQFRTRVPRTPEQAKRLIAAEFPDWTPAGDIIQTITNNNPRRIKQYCQRLAFQKELGFNFELPTGGETEGTVEEKEPTTAEEQTHG